MNVKLPHAVAERPTHRLPCAPLPYPILTLTFTTTTTHTHTHTHTHTQKRTLQHPPSAARALWQRCWRHVPQNHTQRQRSLQQLACSVLHSLQHVGVAMGLFCTFLVSTDQLCAEATVAATACLLSASLQHGVVAMRLFCICWTSCVHRGSTHSSSAYLTLGVTDPNGGVFQMFPDIWPPSLATVKLSSEW